MKEEREGYPIRAVAQLTGLSVDTLRAWERRYGAVTPRRQGHGRLYSESDIERLLLLKEAVDRGHSIGRLASLTDGQLAALLDRTALLAARPDKPPVHSAHTVAWQTVIDAVTRFDYVEADREMSRLAALLSPQDLIHHVVVPLMTAVGEQWHAGRLSIAQEHMISWILNNLLGSLIRLYAPDNPSCTLMFAAPGGEQHEFGIMAAAMLAARGGLGIIYLGPGVPAPDLLEAATRCSVSAVVIGVKGANDRKSTLQHLTQLAHDLAHHIELWVGGDMDDELQRAVHRPSGRSIILKSLDGLEKHLIRMGAQL